MARLGYKCEGCGDEYSHGPAAVVRPEGVGDSWVELCTTCYERYEETGEDPRVASCSGGDDE